VAGCVVRADRCRDLRHGVLHPARHRSGHAGDESGVDLPGLSVTTLSPEPWWNRPASDWVARRVCKYAELGEENGRRPWVLTGRVVGYGPDHEPLLVDVEPVAWLDPVVVEESHRRYHERFDPGRDSSE
jgi:hypothetical protein